MGCGARWAFVLSRESVAWVFNLDAEDELLRRAGPHTPTKVMRARVEALLPQLSALMQPGDEVLWPFSTEAVSKSVHAKTGRAWCPTRWALEQMGRAGLEVPNAPEPEILRRVNHRRFTAQPWELPGAEFVTTFERLVTVLGDAKTLASVSVERNWLMKRPLGYAGRGRRKIAAGVMREVDRAWVEAALRDGDGLQVEPLVDRLVDFGLHGALAADGALTLGHPTVSVIDASGTWLSSQRAGPTALTDAERKELESAARATAQSLTDAGYFGPFGIDAFRWRSPDGSIHFQPRCELNARYSMGWAVGMTAI